MPNEDIKVIKKIRNYLVSNIDEIIYDEDDINLNNIATSKPDQLYIKTKIPYFGIFCEMSNEYGTMNSDLHTHIFEENPNGSFRVWQYVGTSDAVFVISIVEETPSKLINIRNKIKTLLLKGESVQIFNLVDDGLDEYVDIKLIKLSKTYKSGNYPFRCDFRIEVIYKLYEELNLYPADIIQVNIETNTSLPEDPVDPVITETTYSEIPNGIRMEIRKIN